MGWYEFKPYESVAEKKAKAERQIRSLTKKGRKIRPVRIQGKAIATTFWGKAWCENIERYSDYGNRLPRGRSYVRQGSVVHLEVENGRIVALVSGSSLYTVRIGLEQVKPAHWQKIKSRCSGQIGSLIELLQGKLSQAVMKVVTDPEEGLFPKRKEIELGCSCPDYAGMCKHIAAVLYAIGNRLDAEPEMLFALRGIDHNELIAEALPGPDEYLTSTASEAIAAQDLSDIFGIDLEIEVQAAEVSSASSKKPATRTSNAKSISKAKPGRNASDVTRTTEGTRAKSARTDNSAKASGDVSTSVRTSRTRSATKATAKPISPAKAKPGTKPNATSKPDRKPSMKASPKRSSVAAASVQVPKVKAVSKPDADSKPAPKAKLAKGIETATKSNRVETGRARSSVPPIGQSDIPEETPKPARISISPKRRVAAAASRAVSRKRTAKVTTQAVAAKKPVAKRRNG